MLEISDLSTFYGSIEALKGAAMRINEGEMVTVIGANGAGKTTLLKTISGFIKPRLGQIVFLGEEISGREPHYIVDLGICQVLEGRQVFGPLTVKENLKLGAYRRLRNTPSSDIKEDLDQVFELFPRLFERVSQKAGTLSGGEQQMLAIGRALMAKPRLLLLDEPSLGLAPKIIETIGESLQKLNRNGLTILLVEQNSSLALDIAPRCYLMELGRVVLEGETSSLKGSEKVIELYLGAI